MLDSESKFEKVQGIWFDDIDWGVNVGYRKVGDGEDADDDCVYLVNGYAYGCRRLEKDGNGNNGTAFQQRLGKEKIGLQKNGWGIMVGKVSFVIGLIEMVKKNGGSSEGFEKKWGKWFEKDSGESCLKVTEKSGGRNHEYTKKKCKWKLKSEKRGEALEVFKKVFADEKSWATKSFEKNHIDGLCKDDNKWKADKFGKGGGNVMDEVRSEFKETHCSGEGSRYGEKGGYVDNWDVNGKIKVIEGQVFEFGKKGEKRNSELLSFEKMGSGEDIFGERGRDVGRNQISASDWLKSARWDGKLADQSCSSVEQWKTRNSGVDEDNNQCVKNRDNGEGGKWLNDQDWNDLKKKFGFGKNSKEGNCQWLMKEPFNGKDHEDLRPEHTMVMGFKIYETHFYPQTLNVFFFKKFVWNQHPFFLFSHLRKI
ncbi:hypothetical protein MSUIS_06490 [Mycoplasma suis KI3806]|uniref:Uncharacterized protein n=1 Tax=Mycoplasma suis (strain KI_3806) TaxID=708248 RepID=F0V261_MYCS3|nr:hypothetical protein [Mycoplasma suis]CBZ40742.1 hypothetical protein MSUIS_06490 [Mycoplasma suis KI3806]